MVVKLTIFLLRNVNTSVSAANGNQNLQFKEAVQTCGEKISYCRVGSHHQNAIVEHRIKELTLGSWTLLLHATRMLPEAMSTTMWNFSSRHRPRGTTYWIWNRTEILRSRILKAWSYKISQHTTTHGVAPSSS